MLKDLINLTFGRLTVQSLVGVFNRRSVWLCVCQCGKICQVKGTQLSTGKTKSCGCLRNEIATNRILKHKKDNLLLPGEAAKRKLIRSYQDGAKRRELAWSLSELDCVDLFKGDCYYCGDKPSTIAKSGTNQPTVFIFNGIDRINNNLGYIKENVISCCQICNRAKRSMTFDDFMCWVDKISNNYWKNFYAR